MCSLLRNDVPQMVQIAATGNRCARNRVWTVCPSNIFYRNLSHSTNVNLIRHFAKESKGFIIYGKKNKVFRLLMPCMWTQYCRRRCDLAARSRCDEKYCQAAPCFMRVAKCHPITTKIQYSVAKDKINWSVYHFLPHFPLL